jgi:arginine/lysine/ornithine decarboxylase
LDYLSYPTGVIREAQTLAASAFGAEQTWFLVNGTTTGGQSAPVHEMSDTPSQIWMVVDLFGS